MSQNTVKVRRTIDSNSNGGSNRNIVKNLADN